MNPLKPHTEKLLAKESLTVDEAARAMQIMMMGGASPAQMTAYLIAMRAKGETTAEIAGSALTMRIKSAHITAPEGVLDTCGTGGDGSGTVNISTAVALVVAACGVPVAKHGNRAVSSRSGSADVLKALGVQIDAPAALMETALQEAGICFLMAPHFHTAMRHISPVRVELELRTLFNLLGPLTNPAGAKHQVIGVFGRRFLVPFAESLRELGSHRAWIVHGSDGLDEITLAGPSFVAELRDGEVQEFTITPEEAGLTPAPTSALKGGDAYHNARALSAMLSGEPGAYRDVVLLNAAAALLVAGKAADLREGVVLAAAAIDARKAKEVLAQLVEISNRDVE
jgi:anthranilate phosphoribosyltransferase